MIKVVRLNKKGFMLAEVVVVAAVISTVLITLFTGLNRMTSAFETRNKYYDIDAAYLAGEANNYLVKNDIIYSDSLLNTSVVKEITAISTIFTDLIKDDNGFPEVRVYFSLYDKDILSNTSQISNMRTTFKDYISYLTNKLDFSENYTYMIIIEIAKTSDDCYYYALKVR